MATSAVNELERVQRRPDAETRGRQLVIDGRLTIIRSDPRKIYARVRDDGEVFHCGWERGRWFCNCELKGTCAHLHALKLVAEAPGS